MGSHSDLKDNRSSGKDRHYHHHHRQHRGHHHHRHNSDDDDNAERLEDQRHRNSKDRKHAGSRRRQRRRSREEEDRERRHRHSRKRHRKEDDDEEDIMSASSEEDSRRSDEDRHRSRKQKDHKKKKKRKRSSRRDDSDYSDDDDDDRSERERDRHHRSSRKSKKKDKERSHKKSKKDKKRHASSKKEEENKETRPNINPPDKKFLIQLGSPLGHPPKQQLDPTNDYFAFHKHLWVYLHREEGLAFNDMTSEETHEAFARFVKRYNAGLLEAEYYNPKGLPPAALEEAKTTRHTWSFQTSELEDQNLESVQSFVRKQTDTTEHRKTDAAAASGPRGAAAASMFQKSSTVYRDSERQQRQLDGDRGKDWALERSANRRLKEHVRTAEEEFGGGRKQGYERRIEKKKELSAKIHGASKDREAGAAMELSDDAIYGGGGGGRGGNDGMDFQAALAREKKRASDKKQRQESRVAELEAKEKGKQEEMLKLLGLSGIKPGQKIKIAPREDQT